MARRTVIYNDFSFGDFGRIEPWNAPKGSWTGQNMVVYRTGEIGVRAGVRRVPLTGTPVGAVWQMGILPGGTTVDVWFGQGNVVRYFDAARPDGIITTLSGTLTGTPTRGIVDRFEAGDQTFIVTPSQAAYVITSSAVTAMTGAPNGFSIALHGDRMVIASSFVSPSVLRYSAAANFNSWPAANSITVGGSDQIYALREQRGQLQVLKSQAGFYTLTGVPGINETLRYNLSNVGPQGNVNAVRTVRAQDGIWMVTAREAVPSRFDGSRIRTWEHIPFASVGGQNLGIEGFPIGDPDAAFFVQGDIASELTTQRNWLLNRGTWSKHIFGFNPVGLTAAVSFGYLQDALTIATSRQSPIIVMTDGGSASAAPNFYTWLPDIDRPGTENNPFSVGTERAGDDSTAQVTGNFDLPEWWSDEGSEVLVRTVVVEFRAWNTGGSLTNHFDVTVNNIRPYENESPITTETQAWDRAGARSSTSGTIYREAFSFGGQGVGNGVQLKFSNIRGVAIKRIEMVIDSASGRGL